LRDVFGLMWLVGFAVVPEGLAAPLAAELGASDAAVGWLLAADPLGFVAGVFLLSRLFTTATRQRLLGALAFGASAVLLVFVVQPSLWLALLLLAVAGMLGAYQVTAAATVTSWTPNEVRGGVIGVAQTGLRVAQGVGVAAGGAVAELFGSASTAIALAALMGAVLTVPTAAAWSRHLPAARPRAHEHGA
jgi:predicted MFS family arabinose efflux permease